MALDSLLLFFLASLALTLTPGPDILTVITRSVTQGRGAGLVATLGFATGLIAHTTAAVLGLSVLLASSPRAFLAVRGMGVVYLLYLAVRMAMSRDPVALDVGENGGATRTALWRVYGQSIVMNVLNPKVTLFFLAFLPQSLDATSSLPAAMQFILLGGLFAVATVVGFGSCALLAGMLTGWLRKSPGAGRPLRIVTALLFVLIAVRLALPG
jgi:threonine/homoserine/homoserine lactone efflux protein